MKKNNRSLLLFSLGLSALVLLFSTLSMLLCYDRSANYFTVGAVLPFFTVALAIVAATVGIIAAILFPRDQLNTTPFSNRIQESLPAAIAMLLCGVCLLLPQSTSFALRLITTLLLLTSAAYVMLRSRRSNRFNPSTSFVLLGFTPAIACVLLTAYYYFDTSMEMNAPVKVMVQTAVLCAMLYFTCELRYLLGRQKPRLYLALSLCTLAASSLTAIAVPLSYAFGIFNRADYLAGAVLGLGISITVLLRLKRLLTPAETAPTDTPSDAKQEEDITE